MLTKIALCVILGAFFYTLATDASDCGGDFITDEDSRVWSAKVISQLKYNYATCLDSFTYWDTQPQGDCETRICAYTCLAHCVVDGVSLKNKYFCQSIIIFHGLHLLSISL